MGINYQVSMLSNWTAVLMHQIRTGVLTFWAQHKEQYPSPHKLYLKHHSVPATSAVMERCFSAAGYIASARQPSMSFR